MERVHVGYHHAVCTFLASRSLSLSLSLSLFFSFFFSSPPSFRQFDTSFFVEFRAYCWNEVARDGETATATTTAVAAAVAQASGNS